MGKYTLVIPVFTGIVALAAVALTFHKAPAAEPVVMASAPTIDEPLTKTPANSSESCITARCKRAFVIQGNAA
jgi:hypothetical protein